MPSCVALGFVVLDLRIAFWHHHVPHLVVCALPEVGRAYEALFQGFQQPFHANHGSPTVNARRDISPLETGARLGYGIVTMRDAHPIQCQSDGRRVLIRKSKGNLMTPAQRPKQLVAKICEVSWFLGIVESWRIVAPVLTIAPAGRR